MSNYIILFNFILYYLLLSVDSEENNKYSTITCNDKIFEQQCIKMPSKSFINNFAIAPKYKLNVCHIGKSFSSMTLEIFCYLYDKRRFFKNFNYSSNEINFRDMCNHINTYHTINDMSKIYTNNNNNEFINKWKHIMIVREPIKRFISGFVQICVLKIGLQPFHPYCFGCQNNIECFLQSLFFDIQAVLNNFKQPDPFIKYHFYPQTWQCDYQFLKNNYKIIKYNDNMTMFYNNYLNVLRRNSVSKKDLSFINRIFKTKNVRHSTFDKKEIILYKEKVMNDRYILTLLSRIFYYDFIEFNFDLPKIYHP
uniref:Sulfotransfer_1 domain-containing protein n=1 Tax=Strongyloides stercoralis TaxID=6248 RepID=A0A0K0EBL2_STRER